MLNEVLQAVEAYIFYLIIGQINLIIIHSA